MPKNTLFWRDNTLRAVFNFIYRNFSFLRPANLRSIPSAFLLAPNSQLPTPSRGFTIIELITAIGILAILSATVLVAVNPLEQFNKSADTRRKADLAQIQRALEVYYNDHGRYPFSYQGSLSEDGTSQGIIAWGSDFRPYMDVLPIEQKTAKNYAYWADSTGQSYVIFASLDRGSDDPQACNEDETPCTRASDNSITCGGVCNFGVSSANISP